MQGRNTAARYFAARRVRERALVVLRATSDGLALGLLDREGLAAVDELHYRTLTEQLGSDEVTYADEAWNTRGLLSWEKEAITRHFPAGGRVLVTGAGGGREVLALLELGFDALGYDPHPVLVQRGQQLLARHGAAGRLHRNERDLPPPIGEPFDAVVVGWGSFTHVPGRQRRVALLRGLRQHLRPGGVLLVSYWVRSWRSEAHLRLVAGTANAVRRLRRREPVEVGDVLSPNYYHLFDREEIAGELGDAGLTVLDQGEEPYGWSVARH